MVMGFLTWIFGAYSSRAAANLLSAEVEQSQETVGEVMIPCEEFHSNVTRGVGWLLHDCSEVWRAWRSSLNRVDVPPYYRPLHWFHEHADSQRRRGFPCRVKSAPILDGVGSKTLRFFSAWVLAEEMGCDVAESTAETRSTTNVTDGTLYCHATVRDEANDPDGTTTRDASAHCALTDWFSFFNMGDAVGDARETGDRRIIQVR